MTFPASGNGDLAVIPLPAFNDNYIWALVRGEHAAVVDPGDATVVERWLADNGLDLTAILITHHHTDHTGGIQALTSQRAIPVYGPAAHDIRGVTTGLSEGDRIELRELGVCLEVLEVPGHTATHIAFVGHGMLFPGDTLFSAGCGRLLGGTAEQLHRSLERLKELPADTRVYCTHEYTLSNLKFARAAEPDNVERDGWYRHCEALRAAGKPTLPSTIGRECAINPFLRIDRPGIIASVSRQSGSRPRDAEECFARLRAWKDNF